MLDYRFIDIRDVERLSGPSQIDPRQILMKDHSSLVAAPQYPSSQNLVHVSLAVMPREVLWWVYRFVQLFSSLASRVHYGCRVGESF